MSFQKMDGEVPENGKEKSGSVSYGLSPRHSTKTLRAMKAPYSVKRITFNPSEANPGERLEIRFPKLNKNEVLVPGSLALRFDIDLSGGHANNYLVQNVSRALVRQQVVKFGERPWTTLWTTTYTRYLPTYFCQRKRVETWWLRAYRAKNCLRSVQAQETNQPRELKLRTNWKSLRQEVSHQSRSLTTAFLSTGSVHRSCI